MTTPQVLGFTGAYFLALCAVVYVARASGRRVAGALAGGAVVGLVMLGAIVLGEARRWWHVPFAPTPYFLPLFYVGASVSCAPIYVVSWRVARRFGGRGLATWFAAVTLIGPPRDYLYAAKFPEWMVFGPGIAPILADAATYLAIAALGHAVMRLVAGPSRGDALRSRGR